ncbi:hypothetical protein [Actinoplanes sp. DH11]|uniref:hypothetical protein n=1 Tax=Actinoplanes sp. DH11 TaxID=2857011 RepID=UPI001E56C072|nr:hypothetical protein [Actinoplanes sp. DH11]
MDPIEDPTDVQAILSADINCMHCGAEIVDVQGEVLPQAEAAGDTMVQAVLVVYTLQPCGHSCTGMVFKAPAVSVPGWRQ